MSLKNGHAARRIGLRMGCGERLKSCHTLSQDERPAGNEGKVLPARRTRLTGGSQ